MPLTAKQRARLASTPKEKRAALRATYLNQTSRQPAREQAQRRAANAAPARLQPRPPPTKIPNFLDPMVNMPAPTVVSEGKALPYTGMVSSDFAVSTPESKLIIVTNPGDTSTMGVTVTLDANGVEVAGTLEALDIPTLSAAAEYGGPSAMRAMKFSSTLVNSTSALRVGGRVTYLNSAQRLPAITGTNTTTVPHSGPYDFSAVLTAVKTSPYRKRLNAQELTHPRALVGFPCDATHYLDYKAHRGAVTAETFLSYACVPAASTTAPGTLHPSMSNALDRPMSIHVWILEATTQPNDYSLTIRAANYTRWPLTSVPGQIMTPTPTAPADHINSVHNHGEATANELKSVAEGAAGAVFIPKAAGFVRTAGRWMMRGAAAAGEAVEAAAPYAARAGQLALLA